MNGDSEQKGEHPESRQPPENKLQSIRDITKAIKDGDEKYRGQVGIKPGGLNSNLHLVKGRIIFGKNPPETL